MVKEANGGKNEDDARFFIEKAFNHNRFTRDD